MGAADILIELLVAIILLYVGIVVLSSINPFFAVLFAILGIYFIFRSAERKSL